MPDTGWVPVSNIAAQDHRLSWKARGLLTELLSLPDGWETNIDKLVDMAAADDDSHTEGRYAMRAAMRELVKYGYVRKVRYREHGRWKTRMSVKDAVHTTSDFPPSVDLTPVLPPSVESTSLQRRITKTDTKKDLCRDEVDEQQPESGEGRWRRKGAIEKSEPDWPDVAPLGAGWKGQEWALEAFNRE